MLRNIFSKNKYVSAFVFALIMAAICAAILGLKPVSVFAQVEEDEMARAGRAILETIRGSVSWEIEGSAIRLDTRTGTLVVTQTSDNHKIIEHLIRSIDVTPTQVSIETRFIDIKSAALRDLGFTWEQIGRQAAGANQSRGLSRGSSFAADIDIPVPDAETELISALRNFATEGLSATYSRLNDTQLTVVLQAMERTGEANTLSAPKVTVINRQEAVIKIVTENRYWDSDAYEDFWEVNPATNLNFTPPAQVPTQLEEEVSETGIILTVTPDVGQDNRTITLRINPEVSEIASWVSFGTGVLLAQLDTRSIRTNLIVSDGETVVMGGLIKNRKSEEVTKVPLLGDIPLLGRLFKRTTSTDEQRSLLIFVTVNLITPSGEKFRN